jgi:hypothetical protein
MRRKHRVVVEITFEAPTTAKKATQYVRGCLDRIEDVHQSVTRFDAKEFGRVLIAEMHKREHPQVRRMNGTQLRLPGV